MIWNINYGSGRYYISTGQDSDLRFTAQGKAYIRHPNFVGTKNNVREWKTLKGVTSYGIKRFHKDSINKLSK